MKIVWSLFAISDREAIFDYIKADSPRAAARIDDQIEAQGGSVGDLSGERQAGSCHRHA